MSARGEQIKRKCTAMMNERARSHENVVLNDACACRVMNCCCCWNHRLCAADVCFAMRRRFFVVGGCWIQYACVLWMSLMVV